MLCHKESAADVRMKTSRSIGTFDGVSADQMYREHILDHYRNPRNFGKLVRYTFRHKDTNTTCGDELEIYALLKKNKLQEIRFFGRGCAISIAAASMLTEYLKGKSMQELKKVSQEDLLKMLGINLGPVRKKCGLLCLKALTNALKEKHEKACC